MAMYEYVRGRAFGLDPYLRFGYLVLENHHNTNNNFLGT